MQNNIYDVYLPELMDIPPPRLFTAVLFAIVHPDIVYVASSLLENQIKLIFPQSALVVVYDI